MNSPTDTIVAIATAPGAAGIAIVRISGPASIAIAERVLAPSRSLASLPGGRFIHAWIRDPGDADNAPASRVDEAILLLYRAPHSYTREDGVEIQCHGGRISAARILRAVLQAGAVVAEPGEFTRRAFLNGRIDLLQAEAVADLINAQSERAAMAAVEQMGGALSRMLDEIQNELLAMAADLETTLDFSEHDLPPEVMASLKIRLAQTAARMDALLGTWNEGHRLREGALVVIAGRPNVGKSTLLNALLGRDRAIVTDVPGTTRDTLEEQLVLQGIPLRIVDTAGLRDSDCHIEQQGIQRTRNSLSSADLIVYVIDSSQCVAIEDITTINNVSVPLIVFANKMDLCDDHPQWKLPGREYIAGSMKQGRGLDELKKNIIESLHIATASSPHAVISERHRAAMEAALKKIQTVICLLNQSDESMIPIAGTQLRLALDDIGIITGQTCSDQILDSVFSRFCIGK